MNRLEPLQRIDAGVLDVAYFEAGPAAGPVVLLNHGFPYDINAYAEVAPLLAAQGRRVIVPFLRGFGPTRLLDPATPRSGEQAALFDRADDGVRPPAAAAQHSSRFAGPRSHRLVPGVGPQHAAGGAARLCRRGDGAGARRRLKRTIARRPPAGCGCPCARGRRGSSSLPRRS